MRARGPSVPALLLLLSLTIQVSLAGDIYWEGEEDTDNEFLEVKEDSIRDHLKKLVKRSFGDDFFSFFTSSTSTPSDLEGRVDEEPSDLKDDDQDAEGSGVAGGYEPEQKEKTLRVTFSVMEPYKKEYSNRDSPEFQTFSKSLAANVDALFEELPGRQRSSLVRIQSNTYEQFSCKVTLDIVTTGFEDTDKITQILRDHIQNKGKLGNVAIFDTELSAVAIDPDAVQPIETCLVGEHRCESDGQCLPPSSKCNGQAECDDGSDEAGCPTVCTNDELTCDDTRCVPVSARCDGRFDCDDGADEQNCPESCGIDDFRCNDGKCIEKRQHCDRVADCRDGEDELSCECSENEFKCQSDGSCIEKRKACDGISHCNDNSDELNCDQGYFRCRNGKLIPDNLRCNHRYDCPPGDYSDEHNCPCGVHDFKCNNGYCIQANKKCDRTHDCQDGSDEQDCTYGTVCMANQYKCASGDCVSAGAYCNGTSECSDKSDERHCPCRDGFKCRDGTCINNALRCDGFMNCLPDGEDEYNCENCPVGKVRCSNSSDICATLCDSIQECDGGEDEANCNEDCAAYCGSECLPENKICNDVVDCFDGSDEKNCFTCNKIYEFRCNDGECINLNLRCNNINDCKDNSDELECPSTIPPRTVCGKSEFTCYDGSCINSAFLCDGNYDCIDKSDELNCPWYSMRTPQYNGRECHESEFTCYNGYCIPHLRRCDNVYDCSDFSDEQNCHNSACQEHEFQCMSGQCIPAERKCDGRSDCSDQSDENNCYPTAPATTQNPMTYPCNEEQFQCRSGQCVPSESRCNNILDCLDLSDEENCKPSVPAYETTPSSSKLAPTTSPPIPTTTDSLSDYSTVHLSRPCNEDEFQCRSGECIPYYAKCDKIPDCPDNSDEDSYCIPPFPTNEASSPPTTTQEPITPTPQTVSTTDNSNYPVSGNSPQANLPFPCNEDEFQCQSGECVPKNSRCNNVAECQDQSDEDNCYPPVPPYEVTSLPTTIQAQIAYTPQTPDNFPDSRNNPPVYLPDSCDSDQFQCQSGHCIPNYLRCNYRPDCPDQSDEENCSYLPPTTNMPCDSEQFQCQSGHCIPNYLRCDSHPDCSDQSDEENCPPPARYPSCDFDQFQCQSGHCIPLDMKCDSRPDCPDQSDEENCLPPSRNPRCDIDQFQCRSGHCIPIDMKCDSRPDCPDQSDEEYCPPPARNPSYTCSRSEWRCENGPCIESYRRCDGRVDCPLDNSDELDCPSDTTVDIMIVIRPKELEVKYGSDMVLRCRDEGLTRAPVRWIREDGRPLSIHSTQKEKGRLSVTGVEMSDGGVYICEAIGYPGYQKKITVTVLPRVPVWNVTNPICSPYEATCGNFQCIPKSAICDKKSDCADNSDEDSCSIFDGYCQPNQYHCSNRRCVLLTFKCDGDNDCGDGSDELDCGRPVDGPCQSTEFTCATNQQCVPRSFHCDGRSDCIDGSDEIGCAPVYVTKPPRPANQILNAGDTLTLTCEAVGVPLPLIAWRLNWGRVPEKCKQHSSNGIGRLVCPDMQPEDNGAYSCEAINNKGTVFGVPDAIVSVNRTSVCRDGYFNRAARTESECIKCFCFGTSRSCHSADLFTYNMPTPLGQGGTMLVEIRYDARGDIKIDNQPISERYYFESLRNGASVTKLLTPNNWPSNAHPYLTLPETYNGNQLTSYGGHIKYKIIPHNQRYGNDQYLPQIIIKGKYDTLFHYSRGGNSREINARLTPENWQKSGPRGLEPATRENIMMTLDNVEKIFLRADMNGAGVNITDFVMESAQSLNAGLGSANLVEQCSCLDGYTGNSCEKCANGYTRQSSGPWLGHCVAEAKPCPPGFYGDSNTGCRPCPCPLTNRENQFARTCSLGANGDVICDCEIGYEGKNCEYCAEDYVGNPMMPGDSCRRRPTNRCNEVGTARVRLPDDCECKENVQGRYCDQCKNYTFHLSEDFRHGCAPCFCTGVSQQCTSSQLRRKTTTVQFNIPQIVDQVKVYQSAQAGPLGSVTYKAPKEVNLKPVLTRGDMVINDIDRNQNTVYYWSLPSSFAGDKVTSYGGYLHYVLRDVSIQGGQGSTNNAPDIQLISDNRFTFHYFNNFEPSSDGYLNGTLQFLEKGWQRADGKEITREHFLLALADVKTILVKASYSTNSGLATLVSASIETADYDGDGPLAVHVEQCVCPPGYKGTSCEDCAAGYTRSSTGLYLEHCEPCNCEGHSSMCHPETGACYDCADNTAGEHCEECLPGYERDAYQNCVSRRPTPIRCNCNPAGEESCTRTGQCICKQNVEGEKCERCRIGTFGLDANNWEGCLPCYCSGVTNQCHDADYYSRVPIPAPILGENNGGYAIMDLNGEQVIQDHFVPAANESELMYVFDNPPSQDLYWSLPVFPGNRILSYGGYLTLTQTYRNQNQATESQPGNNVLLIGESITLFWTNPRPIRSGESAMYQVPLRENGWFVLNNGAPASRVDFMTVLKNLKRILVKATLSDDILSTAIADVSMDTAAEVSGPPATGIEICRCPEGYAGTSCEQCTAGYYKDERSTCRQCNCNGQNCELGSNGQPVCICRLPYTGLDCSAIAGESENEITTRSPPSRPTVTVTITGRTIKIQEIGSSVNFTCQAQSIMTRVRPVVKWSKNSGQLPQGRTILDQRSGTLTIVDLKASDSGIYICQASDSITTAEDRVTLRVAGNPMTEPTVKIEPSISDYYEGQRIELICSASGNPHPQITWRRASGRPLPLSAITQEAYFIIEGARQEDSGEYRCTATNTAGSADSLAVITVNPRPLQPSRGKLTVNPTDSNVGEGESTRVVCTGTANVPAGSIGWARQDGAQLEPNVRSDNGVLYIDVARLENQGVYLCQTAAPEVAAVAVSVMVTPLNTPSPAEASSITILEPVVSIPTSQTKVVDCTPQGYPVPQIKWSRYQGEFSYDTYQRGNSLVISKATEQDKGYYICMGVVDGIVVNSAYLRVDIEKREPPKVQIWPPGENAPLGGQFEFTCRVLGGIPDPDVTWSRSGGRPLSPHVQLLPHNVLRFDKVEVNDEGEYTCSARNDAGTDMASAILKVRSPPEIFLSPQNYLQVIYNEPVTVSCRASGYPEPLVSIISNTNNRVIVAPAPGVATLHISAVTESDDGDYTCNATSIAGNVQEEFSIRVDRGDGGFDGGSGEGEFGPDGNDYGYDNQPSNLMVKEGENPRITCNVTNERYDVRWGKMDNKPLQKNAVQQGIELVIYNVSKSDSGRYECLLIDRNTNEIHHSAYTTLVVIEVPRITLRPKTQIVNPGQSPTVDCVVEGDNILEVVWRPVKWPFSERVEPRQSTLIFHKIEVEDAGEYECFARNRYANASSVAEVIVSENTDREPLESHENEQYGHVGASVHLRCNVSKTEKIWWSKDGKPVQRSAIKKPDGSLYIKFAQKSDSGYYICTIRDQYGRQTSNYINLHIDEGCPADKFHCYDDSACLVEDLLCDGYSDCADNSDEENCLNRDKQYPYTLGDDELMLQGPRDDTSLTLVTIDQPRRVFLEKENVQVDCKARSRGIKITWERYGTHQYVESRVYGDGALLVIPGVEKSDAGDYRCVGRDQYNRQSEDFFTLVVEPRSSVPSYPPSENETVYRAHVGLSVDLPCDHDLEQPVNIEWRKEYTGLAPNVRVDDAILHIDRVTENNAGIYVCRVSNPQQAIETRAILRVDGIIPQFDGEGYLALPTLQDAYIEFDIQIALKPNDPNGLVLFNGQNEDGTGDYLALQLVDGVPEFVVETASGRTVVRGDRPLLLNDWHMIRLTRNKVKVTMDVDNTGPFSTEPTGRWTILDLKQPLFVGGFRDSWELPNQLKTARGFVGCVSMLVLGREEQNLMDDNNKKHNVNECNTCSPNQCKNNGVCQEARNEQGYTCICQPGFAGLHCDKTGEACMPGICGTGKCSDTSDGYKCACPVTHTGRNCEIQQSIEYPAFTGSAYLAIKTPQTSKALRMSMKIKATAPVQDGIIMYCAESARGHGGFTSLAVHDGRLEFRYDLGDGPVILRIERPLQPNEWTDVHISRMGRMVTLRVDAQDRVDGRLPSNTKYQHLGTPMFVGGVDDSIILNNNTGVSGGFSGCIKDVMVYGDHVNIVNSSIQSANVQECTNYDRGDIPDETTCSQCRNGGYCASDSTSCTCQPGFTGIYCENRAPLSVTRSRLPRDPCLAQPCRNGGTCKVSSAAQMNYTCDCPLGFSGFNCQMPLDLYHSVGFNGNGYLELQSSLLKYDNLGSEEAIIAFLIHTNSDGILLYQYEVLAKPGIGDYILMRVERGVVVLDWNTGGGIASVSVDNVFVNDGERHKIIAKLKEDNTVSLTVDESQKIGMGSGLSSRMNADSNIYIGGMPRNLNIYNYPGFTGCFEQIELMDTRALNIGLTAVTARNTQMCKV